MAWPTVLRPEEIAIDVESGQLEIVLAPLAGDRVTTIVGFTEVDRGRLYNSAAVVHKGAILGVYRKQHPRSAGRSTMPAIRRRFSRSMISGSAS